LQAIEELDGFGIIQALIASQMPNFLPLQSF
jgi:hypothetical protein